MSVPDSFREGSFGLGAGKLRTVFRIILPSAMPGILSGIILGIGRIVGETAALMFTSGSVAKVAIDPMDSGRTLAVHMYNLLNEGLAREAAYATAVVLVPVICRQSFGTREYSVIYSRVSTVFNLIAAFAAMIWAWLGSSFGFTVEFIVALAMLVVILLLGLYIFKAAAGYKKDWTTE